MTDVQIYTGTVSIQYRDTTTYRYTAHPCLQWTIGSNRILILLLALSRLYLADHEAVVVPKPLQVHVPSLHAWLKQFDIAQTKLRVVYVGYLWFGLFGEQPPTHNTKLCWALPYKCWSKVCHVHVVLSTLYQEKMLTEQEKEVLKRATFHYNHLVQIQCTKPPDVVKRTAELLAEVGHHEHGKQLKGQWLCSVCFCLSVMWNLQWTIGINRNFIL